MCGWGGSDPLTLGDENGVDSDFNHLLSNDAHLLCMEVGPKCLFKEQLQQVTKFSAYFTLELEVFKNFYQTEATTYSFQDICNSGGALP